MKAVVTTGQGGFDRPEYRDVPIPELGPGEVLLRVLAAGVNNTEINTRLGWYSSSVSGGTGVLEEAAVSGVEDGGWDRRTPFPFIQGTDCCGEVVARADDVLRPAIGARVLVRACMRTRGFGSLDSVWLRSDVDGAFAQYVRVRRARRSRWVAAGATSSSRPSLARMGLRRTWCNAARSALAIVCW